MPKPRGGAFKALERDTRFAPMVEAALAHPLGTRHETPPGAVADAAHALEIRRGIFRSARHAGVSVQAEAEELADGSHRVWFVLRDKAEAARYVAEKVRAGKRLSYNVRR
jgi:hypothetical protein